VETPEPDVPVDTEMWRRLRDDVRRFLLNRGVSPEDTEDLIQISFLDAFRFSRDKADWDWTDESAFRAKVFQYAKYRSVDHYRRSGKRGGTLPYKENHTHQEQDLASLERQPADIVHEQTLVAICNNMLSALSEGDATLLRYRYMEGMSYKDIASQIGKTSSEVGTNLKHATSRARIEARKLGLTKDALLALLGLSGALSSVGLQSGESTGNESLNQETPLEPTQSAVEKQHFLRSVGKIFRTASVLTLVALPIAPTFPRQSVTVHGTQASWEGDQGTVISHPNPLRNDLGLTRPPAPDLPAGEAAPLITFFDGERTMRILPPHFDASKHRPGGYLLQTSCDAELLGKETLDCPTIFVWFTEDGFLRQGGGVHRPTSLPQAPKEIPLASLLPADATLPVLELLPQEGATRYTIRARSTDMVVFTFELSPQGRLEHCAAPLLTDDPVECPPMYTRFPENRNGSLKKVALPIPAILGSDTFFVQSSMLHKDSQ
jgi:RNA polymerase sigma factor (sigma-70 family)